MMLVDLLADFVGRVITFDVPQILSTIDREQLSAKDNEPYCELLQGLRYFVRHGVTPQVFMPLDLEVIKPLAVALVQHGRENGGLPKEALITFD